MINKDKIPEILGIVFAGLVAGWLVIAISIYCGFPWWLSLPAAYLAFRYTR